jgi:polyisoprenoid-binding protein YceI
MLFRTLSLTLGTLPLLACNDAATTKSEPAEVSPIAATKAAPVPEAATPILGGLTIDASQSSISFIGANVLSSHAGDFKKMSGTIEMTENGPSSIVVDVDTTSIFVEHPKLLGHLRSEDFFFVEKFPTATFKSTKITAAPTGDQTHNVTGDITIRGVTKPQSFLIRVTPIDGGWRGSATFDLKRMDFGVAYKGAADNLIKTEVPITLELVATKSS